MNNQAKVLSTKVDTEIIPCPPFSFDGTIHKPSHFPTPDRAYEKGIYWQSMNLNGQIYGLKLVDVGTIDEPRIALSIYFSPDQEYSLKVNEIIAELECRLDMQSNLQAFIADIGTDSVVRSAINRWRGMRVSSPYSLYEFLVVTTVLQNTVVRRSVQMMQNLFQSYGTLINFDERELYAFWSPNVIDAVDEEELRSLRVGYRAKILKKQAAAFMHDEIDVNSWRKLNKEDLKKKLLGIYGIGPATVQYVLFEIFHHYDALEHIPPWEQKIYSKLLFDKDLVDTSLILEEINRRWGKWKMLAMHYLFEDLFWLRKNQKIPWLEELIKL